MLLVFSQAQYSCLLGGLFFISGEGTEDTSKRDVVMEERREESMEFRVSLETMDFASNSLNFTNRTRRTGFMEDIYFRAFAVYLE